MKGYKAFDKDMKCQNKQYEIGKTYKEDKAELCICGFHFCLNPLDCLNYYDLTDCNFAEVEAEEVSDKKENDTKRVSKKIIIKTKLDLKGFCQASFEYLWKECKKNNDNYALLASSGYSAQLASSGDSAQLASSGNYAQLASSGDSAKLASSGDSAQLASSGDSAQLASSGYSAKLASSGDSAKLASSGYSAKLASSGYSAKLASSGDFAKLASSGKDSIIAGIGINNLAKGKKGSWLVLAEWKDNKPLIVISKKIDGKKIKEDIYYKVENKKLIEVK